MPPTSQSKTIGQQTWPVPSWIPHKPATDCEGALARIERTMKREEGRCIYCALDLVSSVELLLSSELDHLVPKEVFRTPAKAGYTKQGDYRTNLVFCCGPCNDAKANWPLCLGEVDARKILQSSDRDEYLSAARLYTVARRRSQEKKIAGLMAKAWAQRATKLNSPG